MGGLFLKSLEELRKVEWARSWTWDIQFVDKNLPAPFGTWFPATEVDVGLFNLEPLQITGGYGTYEVPKSWTQLSLSITFVDSSFLILGHWLENWVNQGIFGGGLHVVCLEKAVKKVNIAKLDNKRELVSLDSYMVFPTGPLNFTGNSSADVVSHQVEFRIASSFPKEKSKG